MQEIDEVKKSHKAEVARYSSGSTLVLEASSTLTLEIVRLRRAMRRSIDMLAQGQDRVSIMAELENAIQ